jgi:hypothetical protein
MTKCHKCGRPIGYDSVVVEIIKSDTEHTYRFDTEACFVIWVKSQYIEVTSARNS